MVNVIILVLISTRLHRMHDMQTIVTDVSGVCLPVCLSRGSTRLRCAKTAKRIKMQIGANALGAPETLCYTRDTMHPSPNYFGLMFCLSILILVRTLVNRVANVNLLQRMPASCSKLPLSRHFEG